MSKKRVYLSPMEVKAEFNKVRELNGLTPETEKVIVKGIVENAIQNNSFGDKTVLYIQPYYIHIPAWQRKLNISKALNIGNKYNKHKWGKPIILYVNERLIVIDGNHRIYGALATGMEKVVVRIVTDLTEAEAIDIFLEQDNDRRFMSPSDKFCAALEAKKPEYLKFKEICESNSVQIKGDFANIENPVGVFTSITDGTKMAKSHPELLDKILKMLGKLQWNAGNNAYEGKAYSAKVIRVFKALYAYYSDKEELMENILLNCCKGSEYFNDNLSKKLQDSLFDFLAKVIDQNINDVVQPMPKKKKAGKARTKAIAVVN